MALNFTLSLRLSTKEFAYRTGVSFRGLTISQTEKGFNVVIRGFQNGGTPVYSMMCHQDPTTGLELLVQALGGKAGSKMWHADRYYRAEKSS